LFRLQWVGKIIDRFIKKIDYISLPAFLPDNCFYTLLILFSFAVRSTSDSLLMHMNGIYEKKKKLFLTIMTPMGGTLYAVITKRTLNMKKWVLKQSLKEDQFKNSRRMRQIH